MQSNRFSTSAPKFKTQDGDLGSYLKKTIEDNKKENAKFNAQIFKVSVKQEFNPKSQRDSSQQKGEKAFTEKKLVQSSTEIDLQRAINRFNNKRINKTNFNINSKDPKEYDTKIFTKKPEL